MLGGLGLKYTVIYVLVLVVVLGVVGKVLNKVLPGKSSDLLIDLPPIRLPRPDNVITKTAIKSYAFIKEAAPLFMLGALLISLLELTGALRGIQNLLAPLTENFLILPRETATIFIMGMIRRDFGAAGLSQLPLSPAQTLVSLITITLFVPCIASMFVILKERGKKEGTIIWLGSWVAAFVVGGVMARILM
jgi:ferrous iron transport protein B